LFTQYAVWLLLLVVPFRHIPRLFSNPRNPLDNPDIYFLQQIKLATSYASILSLWKNKCLVQSLAARRMLSRRSITSQLMLGVMHNDRNHILTHAWIISGNVEVVAKSGPFKDLFTF
jgi:hypothetical protein